MSNRLILAPPLWRLKPSVFPQVPKALVVGADYAMLTCKRDPCVRFWTPNRAKMDSTIPDGFTILWVADDLDKDARSDLLGQAVIRNIEVWWDPETHCAFSIRRLCEKLFGLWGNPANKSLVEVVAENETTIRDGLPTRIEELKAAAERYKKGIGLKFDKPQPLKARGRPRSQGRLEPQEQAEPEVKPVIRQEALVRLDDYEREVYLFYRECAGANGNRLSLAAGKFHLPEGNAKRLIERVERKLSSQG